MRIKLGENVLLLGKAGTGKTERMKELATMYLLNGKRVGAVINACTGNPFNDSVKTLCVERSITDVDREALVNFASSVDILLIDEGDMVIGSNFLLSSVIQAIGKTNYIVAYQSLYNLSQNSVDVNEILSQFDEKIMLQSS